MIETNGDENGWCKYTWFTFKWWIWSFLFNYLVDKWSEKESFQDERRERPASIFVKRWSRTDFNFGCLSGKELFFYGKIVSFPRDNIMFAWRLSSKKELSETKQKKSLNKLMKDCKTNKCGFNSVTVWSISALALFQSSVIHSNTMAKKQENRPDNQRDVSKARILVNAQEGNDKRVEGRHFLDSNFSRKGMW